MKEEFDLVVEVKIIYLKTIDTDSQVEAEGIAENEAIEMVKHIQEEYELDNFDQEITIRRYRNPMLPSIKLTNRK